MSESESEDDEEEEDDDDIKNTPVTSPIVSITISNYILVYILLLFQIELNRFVRSTLYLMMKIQKMY